MILREIVYILKVDLILYLLVIDLKYQITYENKYFTFTIQKQMNEDIIHIKQEKEF
jgi:hypothetical protein